MTVLRWLGRQLYDGVCWAEWWIKERLGRYR
jgi:hypothetical protein